MRRICHRSHVPIRDAGYPKKCHQSLRGKVAKKRSDFEGTLDVEVTEGRRRSQLHQHMPSALDKHASVVLAPPLQGQLDALCVKSATTAEVRGISMPQLQADEPLLSCPLIQSLIFIVNSKVLGVSRREVGGGGASGGGGRPRPPPR